MTEPGETAIAGEVLRQVTLRGPDKSVCPNDVAQSLGPDWRSKLSAVRRTAIRLAVAGQIEILRKGRPVDPVSVKGVIRLRLPVPATKPDAP